MPCCQCQAIECEFDPKTAAAELTRYRERGPARTTQMLIEALRAPKIEGTTLLDIGGGIGAIQHALLDLGISHATAVEGSAAYLLRRLRHDPFRVFVHRSEDVEATVRANGLAPLSHNQTVVWRVDVYVPREAMGTA